MVTSDNRCTVVPLLSRAGSNCIALVSLSPSRALKPSDRRAVRLARDRTWVLYARRVFRESPKDEVSRVTLTLSSFVSLSRVARGIEARDNRSLNTLSFFFALEARARNSQISLTRFNFTTGFNRGTLAFVSNFEERRGDSDESGRYLSLRLSFACGYNYYIRERPRIFRRLKFKRVERSNLKLSQTYLERAHSIRTQVTHVCNLSAHCVYAKSNVRYRRCVRIRDTAMHFLRHTWPPTRHVGQPSLSRVNKWLRRWSRFIDLFTGERFVLFSPSSSILVNDDPTNRFGKDVLRFEISRDATGERFYTCTK